MNANLLLTSVYFPVRRGEWPLLLLPGFREPPLLLGAVPEQGPHRGAAARRGAREMLAGTKGGEPQPTAPRSATVPPPDRAFGCLCCSCSAC